MVEDKDSREQEERSGIDFIGTNQDLGTRREIRIGSQRGSTDTLPVESLDDAPDESIQASDPQVSSDPQAPVSTSTVSGSAIEQTRSFPPPRLSRVSRELQDEIDAALGDFSVEDLLAQNAGKAMATGQEIELDSRCRGTVVKVHRDSVFFSLGANQEGVASLRQFAEPPEPGAVLEVVPSRFNSDEQLYELVVPGASIKVGDWSDLVEGVIVEVMITGSNKGGLECEVNHIRGFMPASQISDMRVDDFEQFKGQKLLCVVTEANPNRQNLVLSHRAVLEREKQANREKLLAELAVGQIREGTVTRIQDFGAFVDLGGIDGLIHISQLSWDRIKHPSEVLETGQKVKARIEKIDPVTGKIGLSYRDLLINPWDAVDTVYPVGAVVKGTVSKLMEFGAFVRLGPGVEGLVHISELAHRRVQRVSSIVSEGDAVDIKVLSIDKAAQKISLSIKAAQAMVLKESAEATEEENAADQKPGPSIVRPQSAPLKGGLSRGAGGDKFGLKW